MPEGYDPENYYVKHSIDEVIHRWKQRGYLSFFHCGKYEDRKSSTMIIHAFQQAVNESGVMAQLYMKCENPFNGIWFEEFEHARGDCEFIHTYGQGNIENMDILYHNFDFGLYASKGEAFGLPIIESIACGLPTITSNWSGQSEYLKEYPRELLITKGTQELANDGMFFNGNHGNWIVPDYDQLVEKIKYVLENAEDIYRNARQKCVDSVKDFTWKNAVRRLIDG
jgi:glycogen synthase